MFYVLEGIDGAGCGAQRKNIEKKLREKDIAIETMKFPFYKTPVGEMIHEFLHGERKLNVDMQFIFYASQMVDEREKIMHARKDNILLCDRYFPSPLVYQGLRGFSLEHGLQFAQMFKLEVPDRIFFLDTPPLVAYQRKQQEEGKERLDINESDYSFQNQVDGKYRELMSRQVFAPWASINNTRSIDEVSEEIIHCILKDLEKV